MLVVIAGAPGSGKGTHCKRLAASLVPPLPHLSTGALLRNLVQDPLHPLSASIVTLLRDGHLVPDATMNSVLHDRVSQADCAGGYLLDGYPRTHSQAVAWWADYQSGKLGAFKVVIVYLEVTESECLARLAQRALQENRSDDTPEVHQRRWDIFQAETIPVIEFFRNEGVLVTVDAHGTIDEVHARLRSELGLP